MAVFKGTKRLPESFSVEMRTFDAMHPGGFSEPYSSGHLGFPGLLEASRLGGWGGVDRIRQKQKPSPGMIASLSSSRGGLGQGWALTAADALLLPRQDAGTVDDADALQDLIGQLGAHESGRKGSKAGSETTYL